eukprot:g15523.t1
MEVDAGGRWADADVEAESAEAGGGKRVTTETDGDIKMTAWHDVQLSEVSVAGEATEPTALGDSTSQACRREARRAGANKSQKGGGRASQRRGKQQGADAGAGEQPGGSTGYPYPRCFEDGHKMIDRLALNLDLDVENMWSSWYSRLSDGEKVHLLERRLRLMKENATFQWSFVTQGADAPAVVHPVAGQMMDVRGQTTSPYWGVGCVGGLFLGPTAGGTTEVPETTAGAAVNGEVPNGSGGFHDYYGAALDPVQAAAGTLSSDCFYANAAASGSWGSLNQMGSIAQLSDYSNLRNPDSSSDWASASDLDHVSDYGTSSQLTNPLPARRLSTATDSTFTGGRQSVLNPHSIQGIVWLDKNAFFDEHPLGALLTQFCHAYGLKLKKFRTVQNLLRWIGRHSRAGLAGRSREPQNVVERADWHAPRDRKVLEFQSEAALSRTTSKASQGQAACPGSGDGGTSTALAPPAEAIRAAEAITYTPAPKLSIEALANEIISDSCSAPGSAAADNAGEKASGSPPTSNTTASTLPESSPGASTACGGATDRDENVHVSLSSSCGEGESNSNYRGSLEETFMSAVVEMLCEKASKRLLLVVDPRPVADIERCLEACLTNRDWTAVRLPEKTEPQSTSRKKKRDHGSRKKHSPAVRSALAQEPGATLSHTPSERAGSDRDGATAGAVEDTSCPSVELVFKFGRRTSGSYTIQVPLVRESCAESLTLHVVAFEDAGQCIAYFTAKQKRALLAQDRAKAHMTHTQQPPNKSSSKSSRRAWDWQQVFGSDHGGGGQGGHDRDSDSEIAAVAGAENFRDQQFVAVVNAICYHCIAAHAAVYRHCGPLLKTHVYGRNEVYEELMQQRRSSVEDPDAYSFDDVLDEIRMRLDDPRIERNRLAEMDGMLLSSCRGSGNFSPAVSTCSPGSRQQFLGGVPPEVQHQMQHSVLPPPQQQLSFGPQQNNPSKPAPQQLIPLPKGFQLPSFPSVFPFQTSLAENHSMLHSTWTSCTPFSTSSQPPGQAQALCPPAPLGMTLPSMAIGMTSPTLGQQEKKGSTSASSEHNSTISPTLLTEDKSVSTSTCSSRAAFPSTTAGPTHHLSKVVPKLKTPSLGCAGGSGGNGCAGATATTTSAIANSVDNRFSSELTVSPKGSAAEHADALSSVSGAAAMSEVSQVSPQRRSASTRPRPGRISVSSPNTLLAGGGGGTVGPTAAPSGPTATARQSLATPSQATANPIASVQQPTPTFQMPSLSLNFAAKARGGGSGSSPFTVVPAAQARKSLIPDHPSAFESQPSPEQIGAANPGSATTGAGVCGVLESALGGCGGLKESAAHAHLGAAAVAGSSAAGSASATSNAGTSMERSRGGARKYRPERMQELLNSIHHMLQQHITLRQQEGKQSEELLRTVEESLAANQEHLARLLGVCRASSTSAGGQGGKAGSSAAGAVGVATVAERRDVDTTTPGVGSGALRRGWSLEKNFLPDENSTLPGGAVARMRARKTESRSVPPVFGPRASASCSGTPDSASADNCAAGAGAGFQFSGLQIDPCRMFVEKAILEKRVTTAVGQGPLLQRTTGGVGGFTVGGTAGGTAAGTAWAARRGAGGPMLGPMKKIKPGQGLLNFLEPIGEEH